MPNQRCYSCGNTDSNSLEELGKTENDNIIEYDLYCKSCGNVSVAHFDCTQYKQADIEEVKKKYPDFVSSARSEDIKKREARTPNSVSDEEKAANQQPPTDKTQSPATTIKK